MRLRAGFVTGGALLLAAAQGALAADETPASGGDPRVVAALEAAADAGTLQEVIEVVMLSTDRIEKQLSDKDAF